MSKRRKYVGLSKRNFKRHMKEFVDQDYIKQLTDEEKQWLSQFNDEYYNSRIINDDDNDAFHNTDELRKDCYTRQNKAYVDIVSSGQTTLFDIDDVHERHLGYETLEQVENLIDLQKTLDSWGVDIEQIIEEEK